jgi:hypothetical protein
VDNIQKVLLGVLSVAGAIALIVPSGNPIAEPAVVDTTTKSAAEPNTANTTEAPIGEPSIDGNPVQPDFGMPFGAPSQESSPNENPDDPKSKSGVYTPPSYSGLPDIMGNNKSTEEAPAEEN